MRVKFVDPITGIGCPGGSPQYDPNNAPANFEGIPDMPGVYIYGLWLMVNGENKFVPIYVGTAKSLKGRLEQHYKEESWIFPLNPVLVWSNSLKEAFDFAPNTFTLSDIIERYNDMLMYDGFNNKPEKSNLRIIPFMKYVIWFQNLNMYNIKLGIPVFPLVPAPRSGRLECNRTHRQSVEIGGAFDIAIAANPTRTIPINDIRDKIIKTKQKFNNGYYFVYATLADDIVEFENHNLNQLYPHFRDPNFYTNNQGENFAKRVELATKISLKKIGIHTTAKADGDLYPMTIDLTNLKDVLVNLYSCVPTYFHDLTGNFINPLEINVP